MTGGGGTGSLGDGEGKEEAGASPAATARVWAGEGAAMSPPFIGNGGTGRWGACKEASFIARWSTPVVEAWCTLPKTPLAATLYWWSL